MNKITVGILTVSDSCSQGTAVDSSGPNLASLIRSMESSSLKIESCINKCVPDDRHKIEDMIEFWVDELDVDLIVTTGGTGFGSRDVTPEATRTVIEREAHGLTQLMLFESFKITPFASLYRGICGIRKESLIINTPGSKKASGEFLQAIIKCIPHALAVLKNIDYAVKKDHEAIQGGGQHGVMNTCSHGHSKVDISKVARRQRNHQDLYPMIDYDVALNSVLENIIERTTEVVDLSDEQSRASVIGRVLANDVRSTEPFPGFRASIKDGYAVKAGQGCGVYRVLGDSTAGSAPKQSDVSEDGDKVCYRISTGAAVPSGFDAVVQVEDTRLAEEADDGRREIAVEVLVEPRPGQDIREIGSDIAEGQCIAGKGDVISGIELGLFATLNIRKVTVFRHPKIGIMSTGDELVEPWTEASVKPGCIRDSNKVTLMYLLKSKGFDAVDCGSAQDSPNDVLEKMKNALSKVDVLITTGSVSMGEKDLLKKILETDFKATIHFGRVNMKPGKPVTFATLLWQSVPKMVFALPGNPSSASVTSHVLVLPALYKMAGQNTFKPKKIRVQILSAIALDTRPEFMRAVLYLRTDDSGVTKVYAKTTGDQISSRLASLREANGLLCLPVRTENYTRLEIDSMVTAIVIGELNLVQSQLS